LPLRCRWPQRGLYVLTSYRPGLRPRMGRYLNLKTSSLFDSASPRLCSNPLPLPHSLRKKVLHLCLCCRHAADDDTFWALLPDCYEPGGSTPPSVAPVNLHGL